jgi:hypothetical protein
VCGPDGEPLEGASVLLSSDWSEHRVTGADGGFVFDRVGESSSSLLLIIRHPDFAERELSIAPGERDVEIRLEPHGTETVRGTVVLPGGLEDADLQFYAYSLTRGHGVDVEWRRPAFLLPRAPRGGLRISVIAHRRIQTSAGDLSLPVGRGTLDLVVPEGGLSGAVLPVEPSAGSFVPLRAVDESGKPLRRIQFQIRGEDGRWISGRSTRRDGFVVLPVPRPPGSRVTLRTDAIRAGPPQYWVLRELEAVTTLSESDAPVVVTIRKAPEFAFVARGPDGGPLPADRPAQFWITQDGRTYDLPHPDGAPHRAASRILPGLPFDLRTCVSGYAAHVLHVERPGEEPRTFAIRLASGGVVRGRLLDSGGMPLSGVSVRAAILEHEKAVGHGTTTAMEHDGTFEVRGLPAGDARITFLRDGRYIAEAFLRVRAGETVDAGEVLAGNLRPLTGTVFGPGGRGLGGARVAIAPAHSEDDCFGPRPLAATFTHADGSFDLTVPWRSDHVVEIQKPGYGTVRIPFEKSLFENPPRVTLGLER